jgi:hypothetical protein
MTATQNISTDAVLATLNDDKAYSSLLDNEIRWYQTVGHEPGDVSHGSLVEELDRATSLLPKIEECGGPRSAAYFLRRVLSGLRHAAYLQTDDSKRVMNLHAEPERVIFFLVDRNTGNVQKSISRQPITNIDAYRQAIEGRSGKAAFVCVTTAADKTEDTVSRRWS